MDKRSLLLWLLSLLCAPSPLVAEVSTGGPYTLTKDLLGASGTDSMVGGPYSLTLAWGEMFAGATHQNENHEVIAGYYGGRYGSWQALQMRRLQVGTTPRFHQGLQVGVPSNAAIEIDFSDQLQSQTVPQGVQLRLLTDHAGREIESLAETQWTYDADNQRLTLTPGSAWQANTLYEIQPNTNLLSVDGFPMEAVPPVRFVTLLDPQQDNRVLHPASKQGPSPAGSAESGQGELHLHLTPGTLADFSMILIADDPLTAPLQMDPAIIKEANEKAARTGGAYQAPIMIREIMAYNAAGVPAETLAKPVEISFRLDPKRLHGSWIRPEALSVHVLDPTHRLWVKIPGSQVSPDGTSVTAAVTHFSVFALMGSPAGSAADVHAFPVPWRPYGPNAGNGAGQTGTLSDGITFVNLPSECSIRIYTLSGEQVRELRHSDTAGVIARERWDGRTADGDVVASGVYLWRVESASDSKNGKLMIIR